MRAKVMSLCLTSFFLQKQKENIWDWKMSTSLWKPKKTMRNKIKNILIDICFNYYFGFCFQKCKLVLKLI